jgi:hypothetical protein
MEYLRDCIESLLNTSYEAFEVILVDNASTDGSVESIGSLLRDPRIRILRLGRNLGYACACNRGSETALGSILAFLNVDIVVTPDWLQPLVSLFNRDQSMGAAQPKLVMRQHPEALDAAGGYIDIFGCAHERQIVSSRTVPYEIMYAKGAAILIPSNLFTRLGRFDEDFILYYEETDLCWRIWLSGHKVMYVPTSTVFHVRGGITSSLDPDQKSELYLMARLNRFRMILKNYEYRYLLAFMPIILMNQLKDVLVLLIHGARYSALRSTIMAPLLVLRDLKRIIQKRYLAQRSFIVSNRDLMLHRLILPAPPLFLPHEIGDLPLSRRNLRPSFWKREIAV